MSIQKLAFMQWNPMHASTYERLQDISTHFSRQHIIALNGDKYEIPRDCTVGHTKAIVQNHLVVRAGWSRSAEYANKSCGVSIMLCKRTFTVTDVKAIDVGPLDLRGRVLAVRVKKGSTLDITAINMYYPPRPSRTVDKKRWTDTIKAMNKWLVGVMDAARERTTPIDRKSVV